MHHQEAFITTIPHSVQNQIRVSQGIATKPSFNNLTNFKSPQQSQRENLWIENLVLHPLAYCF